MMLFLRSLPIVTTLVVALGFTYAVRYPSAFWYIAGGVVVCIAVCAWKLLARGTTFWERVSTLAFPLLMLATGFGVLLFTEHQSVRLALTVALAALTWVFSEQAFAFSYQPARYQPNALVNLSCLFSIMGIAFGSVTLYNLQLFSGTPYWIIMLIFAAYVVLWITVLHAVLRTPRSAWLSWGSVAGFVLLVSFSTLAWLPALPAVKAAFLTLPAAYTLVVIREDVTRTPMPHRWTFIVAAFVLFLLAVTARWFA